MNNFLTDKYLQQNILIFNRLEDFDNFLAEFQVGKLDAG